LFARKGVRIERIVSTGQSTPEDQTYKQESDEWVLLLTGAAGYGSREKANAIFAQVTIS
jgi:cupin 2 domain-containing protein